MACDLNSSNKLAKNKKNEKVAPDLTLHRLSFRQ